MARGFAASRTKKEFLQELNLTEGHPEHEALYEKMLEEATTGRQRVSQDSENLVPQCREDPQVRPPYTYNQITETARHREILNIYQLASPETRPLYDRGRYFEGNTEENWVVKWCLYHSFRYTDNRNQHRSRSRRTNEPEEGTNGGQNTEVVQQDNQGDQQTAGMFGATQTSKT